MCIYIYISTSWPLLCKHRAFICHMCIEGSMICHEIIKRKIVFIKRTCVLNLICFEFFHFLKLYFFTFFNEWNSLPIYTLTVCKDLKYSNFWVKQGNFQSLKNYLFCKLRTLSSKYFIKATKLINKIEQITLNVA